MRRLLLATALLLSGCQPWGSADESDGDERPEVPDPSIALEAEASGNYTREALEQLPLARYSPKAERLFSEVLDHPWIARQADVLTLTRVMVDDIRLIEAAHRQLTKRRIEEGVDAPSLAEETNIIVDSLDMLQQPLRGLGLKFPSQLYSVLNIPATSGAFATAPIPFQVHKRVHLFTTETGRPTFIDLRVFSLKESDSVDQADSAVLAIVNWHLNALKGGDTQFTRYASPDCVAFIGSGDHNTNHLDPSHGFATTDRSIFVAFLQQGDKLYVLYTEGPREEMQPHVQTFLGILNRRLIQVPTGQASPS